MEGRHVLLSCERGGKYKLYKKDLHLIESGGGKYDCPLDWEENPWQKMMKDGLYNYFMPIIIMT